MVKRIVLLSGQVSSGKTTLCKNLEHKFGFHAFKTKDSIKQLAGKIQQERGAMQEFGERLDRKTKGAWVCEALAQFIEPFNDDDSVTVDAVRIQGQIDAIRAAYGSRVIHIHLTAPLNALSVRYQNRHVLGFQEFTSYDKVMENKTEKKVNYLARVADFVIDTTLCNEDDVTARAASHLGLYGREYLPLVDVLVGGQYGSEGKGHVSSYLAREYDFLVRVGGPNAGHKVALANLYGVSSPQLAAKLYCMSEQIHS